MSHYFIKVSNESNKLNDFLKSRDPFEDKIIIQIDSYGTDTPNIVTVIDDYKWVTKKWTHITGYYHEISGYQTVDLTLRGSDDLSNIWAAEVFETPWLSPTEESLHHHGLDTNPREILFSPRGHSTGFLP